MKEGGESEMVLYIIWNAYKIEWKSSIHEFQNITEGTYEK